MRGLWIGFAASAYGSCAHAAPWMQGGGERYARLAAANERIEGLDAQRYDAYGEFGVGQNWTVTAKAELLRFQTDTDFNADGYRATIRRALLRRGAFVMSAEAGAVYGEAIGGANTGCETIGGEARMGAGLSGGDETREWFGFVEAAVREHDGGCRRERVELGFGQEVAGNVYIVNQYWAERGTDGARSDKIETGLLFRSGQMDWSLAYREETSGRFSEESIVASVAVRF